jgi:hypothetical protein
MVFGHKKGATSRNDQSPLGYGLWQSGKLPISRSQIRIDPHRCAMEAPLPPMPASQAQKQRPQDGIYRVLEIGDQLDRQQGEGPRASSAQEARNGNPFLLEDRKQLSRVPPVGDDLSIAVLLPTDGAGCSDEGGKINPTGKKRVLVFPNRLTCVRVGKLNRSAALLTREVGLLAPTPSGLPPGKSWLFFQGQYLTSLIRPSLYHRFRNLVNITSPTLRTIGVDNTGPT